MIPPWAGRRRLHLCFGCVALLVVGLPVISHAAGQRSLPEKLRDGPGMSNHPLHLVPSSNVRIPDGWPMDWDGSLTCLTCHEKLPSLDGTGPAHLRGVDENTADVSEFCRKCHAVGNRRTAASMHWMAVPRAHMMPGANRPNGLGSMLDSASRQCLGCHDGVNAVESINSIGGHGGSVWFADRSRNHPIGIAYPKRANRSGKLPLRQANLLPPEIELPEGKVSCVSCHDLYGTDRKLLTIPISGSQLCFACHQMD